MGNLTAAETEYMIAHQSDNKGPQIIASNVICLTATIIAFVLRFVSRRLGHVKLGIEDWLIVIATVLTTSCVTALLVAVHFGLGKHNLFVPDMRAFMISIITFETLYAPSICFSKLSILALYKRLFPVPWIRRSSIIIGIFIFAYTVTKVFADIFQCVPIKSYWTPNVQARCIDFQKVVTINGVINIMTDIVILILPMPVLWNLRLDRPHKWALTLMLSIGGFVCIISIVRIPYMNRLKTADPSWDWVWILALSSIECCAAVIAACIPTYRPLFNFIVHGNSGCILATIRNTTGPARSWTSENTELRPNTQSDIQKHRDLGRCEGSKSEVVRGFDVGVDEFSVAAEENSRRIVITETFMVHSEK